MMTASLLLSILAGGLVGFILALVGGGGSILAVPLLLYVVGVRDPHVAIGTSAIAVAANALLGVFNHARRDNIKWRCALTFAFVGSVGALMGSTMGKAMDGQQLLALFAVLMIVVAALMFKARSTQGDPDVRLNRGNAPKLVASGAATGLLSGFFGIGGGFLVVPGLMASTRMPIMLAIGSSLVAVSAFGLTTAASYAASGLINWPVAATFVLGGALGSSAGTRAAIRLADSKGALNLILATLIVSVALYMLYMSASQWGWL